jgi:hypothetical protein
MAQLAIEAAEKGDYFNRRIASLLKPYQEQEKYSK